MFLGMLAIVVIGLLTAYTIQHGQNGQAYLIGVGAIAGLAGYTLGKTGGQSGGSNIGT